jgi:hypothetical protein
MLPENAQTAPFSPYPNAANAKMLRQYANLPTKQVRQARNQYLGLQPPLFTAHTNRILTFSPEEIPTIFKGPRATLAHEVSEKTLQVERRGGLTTQTKQPTCHSAPSALTTVSVTGFLHPLHLVLYRCVWQFTHQAYPSFSTKGVVESNGSPH